MAVDLHLTQGCCRNRFLLQQSVLVEVYHHFHLEFELPLVPFLGFLANLDFVCLGWRLLPLV